MSQKEVKNQNSRGQVVEKFSSLFAAFSLITGSHVNLDVSFASLLFKRTAFCYKTNELIPNSRRSRRFFFFFQRLEKSLAIITKTVAAPLIFSFNLHFFSLEKQCREKEDKAEGADEKRRTFTLD